MKKCTKCLEDKPFDDFGKSKKNKDGHHYWCFDCRRVYDREFHKKRDPAGRARKLDLMTKWKNGRVAEFNARYKNRPCTDCKKQFHPAAMQFDHLHDKKFNIGDKKASKSWEELDVEIAKCEIVCANCHAIRTYERAVGNRQ